MTTTAQQTIRFSRRVSEMQVSPTIAVMNRAAELTSAGIDVVDLGPGEPDFDTPSAVCDAARKAIDDGLTRYTNAMGTPALRNAVADRYNRRYGTSIAAVNVIAGTGGKQELFNAVMSLVSSGDEVIIPAPYWVSFPDQVLFAGGTPVFSQTTEANRFRPTLASIEAVLTPRTRGVIINSPCNPTGAVIDATELQRIVELCHERGLFLISDETYELFVYDGSEHATAIRFFEKYPETVIVVNSMSKTFAMTGWRLGYAIAHPSIVSAMGKIQSHSTTNPSSISQAASLVALGGDDSEPRRMYDAYVQRRAWLIPALNSIDGIECGMPDGTFYAFPRISALFGRGGIRSSSDFATYLLDRARVAVVPGIAFGNDEYMRISYATSLDRLQEGVRRIRDAVAAL